MTEMFVCLQDSAQVVESYKSGFEPPGDVEFEDYGQAMKRTASETSLTNSRPDVKTEKASKSKSKLWPFKKNKVKHKQICIAVYFNSFNSHLGQLIKAVTSVKPRKRFFFLSWKYILICSMV